MAVVIRVKPKKTVADYMALPVEHGVELIEGEFMMSPSPGGKHQRLVVNLCFELETYLRKTKWGKLFVAPFDVVLSPEIVLQPDLLIVSRDRLPIANDNVQGAPDLVVEIISPTSSDRDRFVKRQVYERFGVREYWIVDPPSRTVEALALRDGKFQLIAIFEEKDRLSTPLLPDLELDISTVWPRTPRE